MAGVEELDPGRELGLHIEHMLAAGDRSLGRWAACAVGSFKAQNRSGYCLT